MTPRSVYVMTSTLIPQPDIRAKMDEYSTDKINIHIGTMYISMGLDQFDELILAVSTARAAKVVEQNA
jgi:hypothetical protein